MMAYIIIPGDDNVGLPDVITKIELDLEYDDRNEAEWSSIKYVLHTAFSSIYNTHVLVELEQDKKQGMFETQQGI